jgi:hypothetical protein
VGFASLFVLWQLASLYLVSSVLFPPPTVVFKKALALAKSGVLFEHLWASLQRILAGLRGRIAPGHSDRPGHGLVPAGAQAPRALHGVLALHPVRRR